MNKNDVLEILDYMFEFIFSSAKFDNGAEIDDLTIKNYLTDAGFDENNIDKALDYLITTGGELPEQPNNISKQKVGSIRIFSPDEISQMTKQGCALLLYLELNKTLSPEVREIIIEHAKSNPYPYEFEEFMWLTQLAVLNQDNPELREVLFSSDYEMDKNSAKH